MTKTTSKPMVSIVQITEWPSAAIEPLLCESEEEGFRFLRRLSDEWQSGANRFSGNGEAFFGVVAGEQLLAVGGINREADDCGRLRRFYVMRQERRKGIGRQLVLHILRFASLHYARLCLRTDTEAADRFYTAMGFSRLPSHDGPTHIIDLTHPGPQAVLSRVKI